MQAIREMIKAKNKDCHISLPEWAVGLDLEVIILPIHKQKAAAKETSKTPLMKRPLARPIILENFSPMSRDMIYER
jgi:hypothetical protein